MRFPSINFMIKITRAGYSAKPTIMKPKEAFYFIDQGFHLVSFISSVIISNIAKNEIAPPSIKTINPLSLRE